LKERPLRGRTRVKIQFIVALVGLATIAISPASWPIAFLCVGIAGSVLQGIRLTQKRFREFFRKQSEIRFRKSAVKLELNLSSSVGFWANAAMPFTSSGVFVILLWSIALRDVSSMLFSYLSLIVVTLASEIFLFFNPYEVPKQIVTR